MHGYKKVDHLNNDNDLNYYRASSTNSSEEDRGSIRSGGHQNVRNDYIEELRSDSSSVRGGGSFADVDLFEEEEIRSARQHYPSSSASPRHPSASSIKSSSSSHSSKKGKTYQNDHLDYVDHHRPPSSNENALYKPKSNHRKKSSSHRKTHEEYSNDNSRYEHSYDHRFDNDDRLGHGYHSPPSIDHEELYDEIPDNLSVRSGGGGGRGDHRSLSRGYDDHRGQYRHEGRGGRGGYSNGDGYDMRSERSVNPFEDDERSYRSGRSRHSGGNSGQYRGGDRRKVRDDDRSVRSLNPFDDARSYHHEEEEDIPYHRNHEDDDYNDIEDNLRSKKSSRKKKNKKHQYYEKDDQDEGVSLLGGSSSGERIILSDGGQGRPCFYLVFALILMITGIAGAQWFMKSDCVKNAMEVSDWSNKAGYDIYEFIGLCLQTYLLPFGFCFFFIFISQSTNHPAWSHKRKSITYGCLALSLLIFSMLSAWIYADNLLGCLTTSLCADNTVGKYESGYVITTGLIYSTVTFPLAMILTLLAARNAKQIGVKETPRMFSRSKPEETNLTAHSLNSLDKGSYSSNPSLPRNKKSNRWSIIKQICAVLAVLILLLPLMIFLCMLLPDEFTEMTHYAVQHYESEKVSDSQGPVLNFKLSNAIILKLYPDIAMFYGTLYLVALFGMFAHLCQPFSDLLASRAPACCRGFLPNEGCLSYLKIFIPTSFADSIGEVLLICLLMTLLAAEGYYWFFLHGFQCNLYFCHGSSASKEEQLARTLGQLGNVVMGLLVLPVSRHSVLAPLLGVSWDKTVKAHTFLGYLFLIIAIAHEFTWWMAYKKYGLFPKDVLPFPSSYDPDNWAIGLQVGTAWIVFVVMGLMASWLVRRKAWELFHVSHHVFLALFIATLWHATSSWQYVLCGLSLWFLDRFLRLGQTSRRVHVQGLTCHSTDDSCGPDDGFGDDDSGAITVLSYTINAKGMYSMPGGLGGLKEGALHHEVGQFVLVNISALSTWEWHPFSISSSPCDSVTTHHIKARGKHTWTGRLLALARQAQGGSVPLENLMIKIEGPYGMSPHYKDKAAVLLIAGGVGITPIHGLFRAMYKQAQSKTPSSNFQFPDLVRLVWVAPDAIVFDVFIDTLLAVVHDDLDNRFSFKLHDSKAYRPGLTRGKLEIDVSSNASSNSSHRSYGKNKTKATRLPYENGRPSLDTEFRRVEQFGSSALVYCVGPDSLKKECSDLAANAGVPFRTDNFEL